ncbi:MAG: hypothetical protein KC550_06440 [Nanoarchaeota archaeon]|nr:hypothetical protein [Nanoarchaeota archaeon]
MRKITSIIFLTTMILFISKCTHSIFQTQKGACITINELEGSSSVDCDLALLELAINNKNKSDLIGLFFIRCLEYIQEDKKCNKKSDKIPYWVPSPN